MNIRLHNLRDLEFDLARSLKVKSVDLLQIYIQHLSNLAFALFKATKAQSDGAVGLPIYDLILVFKRKI